MARPVTEINAGSMADIAFLLLIFFLVTTTMDIDSGISRRLPPPVEGDVKEIPKRNTFVILVNSADQLSINGERGSIDNLKLRAKEFLTVNIYDNPKFPETKIKEIPLLGGPVVTSKGVISLQNDRGTSYDMYIQVQNELTVAVNELRDELCRQYFSRKFSDLDPKKKGDKAKIKAIRKAIPISISEAEPKNIGG